MEAGAEHILFSAVDAVVAHFAVPAVGSRYAKQPTLLSLGYP